MEPIPFNKAICLEDSMKCVEDAIRDNRLSGNGRYTKLCSEWLEDRFGAKKVLMTTSCTAALEMAELYSCPVPSEFRIYRCQSIISS